MSSAADVFNQHVRRVLFAQAILTLIVAAAFWLAPTGHQTPPVNWQAGLAPEFVAMLSALYGGLVTTAGAWWLSIRVRRAGELARRQPQAGQISLYAGSLARLLGTLLLIGIAFGVLNLRPIPLVVGFFVAQLGFLVNVGGTKPSV